MGKNSRRLWTACAFLLLALPIISKAQLIDLYDNGDPGFDPGLFDAGNPILTLDGQNYYPAMIVDSFTLNLDSTISALKIYGGLLVDVTYTFTINFYADNNGSPGALLDSQSVSMTEGSTEVSFANFLYTGTLSAPVALQAGSYFLGSWNTGPYPWVQGWSWSPSPDGQGTAFMLDSALATYNVLPIQLGVNTAFELDGTEVPEPSAYCLFLLAVAYLIFMRRTKNSQP